MKLFKIIVTSLVLLAGLMFTQPTPTHADGTLTMKALVIQAAYDQGADANLSLCIVEHESHFDPYAISPTNDYGLWQFHVFGDGSSLLDDTPFAGGNILDAYTNAEAGAWLLAHGYARRWMTLFLCTS